MALILSIANAKGGVGKTSTTINIAGELAKRGKVLIIDNDPQSNITLSLLPNETIKHSMVDIYTNPNTGFGDIMLPYRGNAQNENGEPTIWVVPNILTSSQLEFQLINAVNREGILLRKKSTIPDDIDFVIVDTSPYLGTLTMNGILLSDYMISVIDNSEMSLQGLYLIDCIFRQLQACYKQNLYCIGVLRNNFDSTSNYSKDFSLRAQDKIGNNTFVTVIKRSVKYKEALANNLTIQDYTKDEKLTMPYVELVDEILNRIYNT